MIRNYSSPPLPVNTIWDDTAGGRDVLWPMDRPFIGIRPGARRLPLMNRKTFVILLLVLICLANLTRWAYRSHVSGERFSAESAAHFRYTRMIASGEKIPRLDIDAQYPEGLKVFEETSIGMEYLYGLAWRLIPGDRPPLDVFIRWFSVFLFTLAAIPLSLLSIDLWGRRSSGIVTAFLFAVALPVAGRSSGFDIIRENLTLPLIVFHAWLLVRTVRTGSRVTAALSAAVLFLALASWQGTQFYLVPLVLFLTARAVSGKNLSSDRKDRGEMAAGLAVVAAAAAAAAAVPFLRAGGFPLSPIAALCAGLAGALLACRFSQPGKKGNWTRLASAAAGITAVLVPALMGGRHFSAYSHLLGVIAYKLKYIYKPSDPTLLPFDVRAFWVGPFHSPDLLHIFVFALPLLLLLPMPLKSLARRVREDDLTAALTGWLVAVFFVLFLFMMRILPFFGAFAIVIAGGLAADRSTGPATAGNEHAGGGKRIAGYSVVAVIVVVMILQVLFWEGRADIWRQASRALSIPRRSKYVVFPIQRDPEGAMLEWISSNTGPDDVIMSLHYLSPQILTYTGRPANLNDFFEAPRLRAKVHTMLLSLYSSEEKLLSFCESNGSEFLVLSAAVGCDPTRDSPLYQAGFDHLPPGCAAYRLMFEPRTLKSFDLVYENEIYRVFKVGEPPVERRRPASPLFYRKSLLWRSNGDIEEFYNTVMHMYAVTVRSSRLIGVGSESEAEGLLAGVLRIEYFYPAWRLLDILFEKRRVTHERLALAEFAWVSDPWRPVVCLSLAESRLSAGDRDGARETLTVCAALPMTERETVRFERIVRVVGLKDKVDAGSGE